MLRHPGNHLGDAWFYTEGNICHCFYLTCPLSEERHTCWDIAHATSEDMVHWQLHGLVIEKGGNGEWDQTCLSTGTILKRGEWYWMAYTGKWDDIPAKVGLARSRDLYHWEKCPHNPVGWPDGNYYAVCGSGARKFSHWRDPFLMEHEDSVYMLTCATNASAQQDASGTVGVMRTTDMIHWEYVSPPQIEEVCQELECPQVFHLNGKYILLFSSYQMLFSQKLQTEAGNQLRQTSYYMVSDHIWGPYRFIRDYHLLPDQLPDPCANEQYANRLVQFHGKTWILGTVWSENGDYIADPREVTFDPSKCCLNTQK